MRLTVIFSFVFLAHGIKGTNCAHDLVFCGHKLAFCAHVAPTFHQVSDLITQQNQLL